MPEDTEIWIRKEGEKACEDGHYIYDNPYGRIDTSFAKLWQEGFIYSEKYKKLMEVSL